MDWWQERVWKMLYGELPKSNPDALITMRETAEAMLLDAYAGDPAVTMWLVAHDLTIEDIEAEIARLRRAIEGRRVPRPMIDILKMREEVAEKRMALGKAVIVESVLEPALKGEKWALEKMLTLGYTRVEDLEAEANRLLEEIGDPDREVIEPITLRNHTQVNIASLAVFIQTEGSIGFSHSERVWVPHVGMGMGIIEPMEYTGRLIGIRPYYRAINRKLYTWSVTRTKALGISKLVQPYLIADKWEEAKYVLNIGKNVPDTMFRPMYIGYVDHAFRPVFLYSEYVGFPTKYAVIVKEGQLLPRPIRPIPIRYTSEGKPIYWYEGMRR